ncbi:PilZ domain-containing protein [Ramlibacter sp.]|uniref:PilZ domain-containing protein n=1 Tax=Ramlibacter sp. TaxID=1917967 RepID=UPI002BD45727|nr:PilZ domain-containing protein [Ramlibacter sp.]HWI81815.1 PilZ domain-containing protein [Ramlibacter sp.]
MFEEQRIDPRERLALPLTLGDGSSAVTRDISATGLFFEIDGEHAMQGPVDFELELPEVSMRFTSSGVIVRLERRDGKTGVAVRLIDPRLEYVDPGG